MLEGCSKNGIGVDTGAGINLLDPVKCTLCYIDSRRKLGLDEDNARRLLAKYKSRTELFFESYSVIAGSGDPMANLKKKLNERALEILPRLREKLADTSEALKILAHFNAVDVWMPWHRFSEEELSLSLLETNVIVKNPEAVRLVSAAKHVVILLDNAGEAVFDIAYGLLQAAGGKKVTIIAKSQPYETDVTVDEARVVVERAAKALGLDKGDYRSRLRVIGTGSRYPAPATGYVDASVLDELRSADAVLSKGLANYEALTEYCSVEPAKAVILLRAKCPVIARILGVELGAAVVAQGYRCNGLSR